MNNLTPLVSIIVPVYNVERYLRRAVNSILNQTYKNLEIILVDDGSPDNCPKICDEYSQLDSRVKVIHKVNEGVSSARNIGLDNASGELITFLDSDDWVDDRIIEIIVNTLISRKCDAVCVGINIVNGKDDVVRRFEIEKDEVLSGIDVAKKMLRDTFPYNFCYGKIFKRELFESVRFPEGRLYEDMATTYKAMSKARRVYLLSECLYYYFRDREGNTTSELKSERAAYSYYCGCINCTEFLQFCKSNMTFSDVIPDINYFMSAWSKLCIESAIKLNREEYEDYCRKIEQLMCGQDFSIPRRLKMILKYKGLYYYLYPIFGRHS